MQDQPAIEAPDIDILLTPHDPARLHPLANLDKETLDYIILEDEQIKSSGALPSRGWTDDLCYGTGATYLTGLSSSLEFFPMLTCDSSWNGRNVGIHRGNAESSSECPGTKYT